MAYVTLEDTSYFIILLILHMVPSFSRFSEGADIEAAIATLWSRSCELVNWHMPIRRKQGEEEDLVKLLSGMISAYTLDNYKSVHGISFRVEQYM